jgi:hypothetical protein
MEEFIELIRKVNMDEITIEVNCQGIPTSPIYEAERQENPIYDLELYYVPLLEKVEKIRVTEEIVDKWNTAIFAQNCSLLKEFNKDTCTYAEPPQWPPQEDVDLKDQVPQEWLDLLSEEDKDTVLGLPKTKEEFFTLKNLLSQMSQEDNLGAGTLTDHPEFPTYSDDMQIKWIKLVELEENRKRAAEWREMIQDMSGTEDHDLKGMLVVYVNVGGLSNIEAEAYMNKIRRRCKDLKHIPLDYGVMWLPVRPPEQNRVELIRF